MDMEFIYTIDHPCAIIEQNSARVKIHLGRHTRQNADWEGMLVRILANAAAGLRPVSKDLQGRLLVFLDIEQAVKAGDFENFKYIFVDIAHDQLAAGRLHLLIQRDELA